jgi:predicted HicB family RNase H-like nuclease
MVSVGKISVSMPTDVIETVKAAAAAEGISVSAWMTHAA